MTDHRLKQIEQLFKDIRRKQHSPVYRDSDLREDEVLLLEVISKMEDKKEDFDYYDNLLETKPEELSRFKDILHQIMRLRIDNQCGYPLFSRTYEEHLKRSFTDELIGICLRFLDGEIRARDVVSLVSGIRSLERQPSYKEDDHVEDLCKSLHRLTGM